MGDRAQQELESQCLVGVGVRRTLKCHSAQRQQMISYGALNKGMNCSSERELLSNKCRISWLIAKPEQVSIDWLAHTFPTYWRCSRIRRLKIALEYFWGPFKDSMLLRLNGVELVS